jgi:hypothetical protein
MTIFDVLSSNGTICGDAGFCDYPRGEGTPAPLQEKSSSQRVVQEQLSRLLKNPVTPQSAPQQQQHIEVVVLPRCEWLEILKKLYFSSHNHSNTRQELKDQLLRWVPIKNRLLDNNAKVKCLSLNQILEILEAPNNPVEWDDLMEEVMALSPYSVF